MSKSDAEAKFGCLAVIVILALFGIEGCAYRASADAVTFTVKSKTVKRRSESSDRYLIFTDKGVFENTDSLVFGKWDSSDVYGEIEAGKTYRAKVAGWRVPFLSWKRNIISIQEK